MEREERYTVIKDSDALLALDEHDSNDLNRILRKIELYRGKRGAIPLVCVVVESDWPEYEPVWKAIEQRVDSPQPLPKMNKDVLSLVNSISKAVLADEISEGCDISAGIFGPAFSQLVHQIAESERKALLFDQIHDLIGYVQNGTDTSVSMFQDDATLYFGVTLGHGNERKGVSARSLEEAIRQMHKKYRGS